MRKAAKYASAIFFSIFMLVVLAVSVFADNEYSIPMAEFEVVINEDGSASVHESWQVRFISGDFTRFYKDLSTADLPKDESFTSVSDVAVYIDGTPCEYADDTDSRPEYHYNLSSDTPGATLSAYVKSSKVTRTYDFYYTLNDAVKCVDDSYNLFVYRFIGANFSKKVDAVEITVTVPEQAYGDVLYVSDGESSADGNRITTIAKNCSGMYKYRLRIDGTEIPGAVNITSDDLTNKTDDNDDDFSMTFIGIAAAIWAAIVALAFRSKMAKNKIRKQLKNDGMLPIYQLLSGFSSVLEPTELVEEVEQSGWLLPVHLASMVSRGLLISTADQDNQVTLAMPENYLSKSVSPADAYIYEILKEGSGQKAMSVSMQVLTDRITGDQKEANKINTTLRSLLHKQAEGKMKDKKELKKSLGRLRTIMQEAKNEGLLPAVTSEELFRNNVNHANALYYQANRFHGDPTGMEGGAYSCWDQFYYSNTDTYDQYTTSHS
ncbi:MAG: DUF2207 domain-containing protein, partial [Clostridiales bacterium]|nr:DUF2207 domain-containing protein [Candidatus Blautia equi]